MIINHESKQVLGINFHLPVERFVQNPQNSTINPFHISVISFWASHINQAEERSTHQKHENMKKLAQKVPLRPF